MNRQKLINAFINCVKNGVISAEYAIIQIENQDKYGFLTDSDKKPFYDFVETLGGHEQDADN